MCKNLFSKLLAITITVFMAVTFLGCPEQPSEPTSFTVTYVSDFGETPASITVESDSILTEEQLPVLQADGYTFEGWYDGDTKVEPDSYQVVKDISLTAKWTKNTSDDAGDQGDPEDSDNTDDKGDSDDAGNQDDSGDKPADEGKKDDPVDEGKKDDPADNDETPPVITYTITYIDSVATAPKTVTVDENTVLTTDYLPKQTTTNISKLFKYWKDESGAEVKAGYKITKNVTFTAVWDDVKYTVTYNAEYLDVSNLPSPKTVLAGSTFTSDMLQNLISSDGTKYIEYWVNEKNEKVTVSTKITQNMTITAKWKDRTNNYTITYVSDYDTQNVPVAKTEKEGYKLLADDLPNLSKSGYNFKGWFIWKNETYTQQVTAGYLLQSESITLKAKWVELKKLTFAENDCIIPPEYANGVELEVGSVIKQSDVPNVKKITNPDNSYLEYWGVKGTNPEERITFGETKITQDMEIYPHWTLKPQPVFYTITYITKSDKIESKTVPENSYFTEELLPTISRDNYIFQYWLDDFETIVTTDYQIKNNVVLTAVWAPASSSGKEGFDFELDIDDVEVSVTDPTDGNTVYTLTASEGFDDYSWTTGSRANNTYRVIGTGRIFKLDTNGWNAGNYYISVDAVKNGVHFNKTVTIKIGSSN